VELWWERYRRRVTAAMRAGKKWLLLLLGLGVGWLGGSGGLVYRMTVTTLGYLGMGMGWDG
jgi:hypothetical protein